MWVEAAPTEPLSQVLDAAENASPLHAVEAVTGALAAALNAEAAFFLIADVSGRGFVRLSHVSPGQDADGAGRAGGATGVRFDDDERAESMPFDGGPAEEALRTQSVQVVAPTPQTAGSHRDQWVVLAPVTERGEALGLLRLTLPDEPATAVLAQIARIGHVLAFVVIANRRHTDLFEWAQRSTSFTLP